MNEQEQELYDSSLEVALEAGAPKDVAVAFARCMVGLVSDEETLGLADLFALWTAGVGVGMAHLWTEEMLDS